MKLKYIKNTLRYRLRRLCLLAQRNCHRGYCSICDEPVWFSIKGDWLRDNYKCDRCESIPRWRALMIALNQLYPNWRDLAMHESSPGGPLSRKLKRECKAYIGSQYFGGDSPGAEINGFRNEDLRLQTFPDASFDIVITSDVFEHVFDAEKAYAEITRTLKPGGAHIFTVPWYKEKDTLVRARMDGDQVVHLEPPDYHGNPISPEGSLVVTEWGRELPFLISQWSGLPTSVYLYKDRSRGIDGEFLEVFVTRKPLAD